MHTKVCLNVRHRVVSPSPHRRKNCVSRNQAQTLSHERVTRQPPTLDCGSTAQDAVDDRVGMPGDDHPTAGRENVLEPGNLDTAKEEAIDQRERVDCLSRGESHSPNPAGR